MRTVRWLHISDLHIQEAENAQRQAVLSEMLDEISRRSKTGVRMDFVVATGDLAFSGKCSEYELVAGFLSNLVDSVGISSDKVFPHSRESRCATRPKQDVFPRHAI